jgi:hypothetical protein
VALALVSYVVTAWSERQRGVAAANGNLRAETAMLRTIAIGTVVVGLAAFALALFT